VGDVKVLKKQVAVFGPSQCWEGEKIYEEAFQLGTMLADAGMVVMTGGYPSGVVLAVNDGCSSRGGETLGVGFKGEEAKLIRNLSRTKFAPNLPQRLGDLMAADAFISFSPRASSGTLVELLLANEMQRMISQADSKGELQPVLLVGSGAASAFKQLSVFISSENSFIRIYETVGDAVDYLKNFFSLC
jgi:predicted Rossmann-fold nucleotide-binding protein